MTDAAQFYPLITACASKNALPWWLLYGVIEQESSFDPNAVSSCGALGLMQLMPSSFPAWSRTSLLDAANNVKLGSSFLRQCIAMWAEESPDEAIKFGLASYNGGSGYVLAAQEMASQDGADSHNWASVSRQLPNAICNGKRCDFDQVIDYVARIWAKFEARRIAPPPPMEAATA